MNMKSAIFGIAVLALAMSSAFAQTVTIDVIDVTASSEIGGAFDRLDDYLIDGSGLTGGAHTSDVEGNMWLSTGTDFGGEDLDPSVTFDLGAVHTIVSFHVWNYNEVNLPDRGVNDVSVEYGTTMALGSTVAGITNFAQATGVDGYTGEEFNSFTPFEARYIKFDINSNHGGDNVFYGLSEVEFYTLTITPSGLFAIAGESYSLTAPAGGTGYQWSDSGGDITDGARITGSNTNVLAFDPVEEVDIDNYTVTYDDGGAKAAITLSYDLFVFPTGTMLPLMGLAGLCILMGAGALGGVSALRQKK